MCEVKLRLEFVVREVYAAYTPEHARVYDSHRAFPLRVAQSF